MRRQFPIQLVGGGWSRKYSSIPWEVIQPHEEQALKNHRQTLERLAERGGLDYTEAYAVLNDKDYERNHTEEECELAVLRIVRDFYIKN